MIVVRFVTDISSPIIPKILNQLVQIIPKIVRYKRGNLQNFLFRQRLVSRQSFQSPLFAFSTTVYVKPN